jgi:hypothetical protein
MASESRPVESVTSHAAVLSAIVATAAAIDSHRNRYRRGWLTLASSPRAG